MITRVERPDGLRVASGVVQFGEDWPGVFIRGDEALGLASMIRAAQATSVLPKRDAFLANIVAMLESCRVER